MEDYPGSMLSFASGSTTKIITAGGRPAADRSLTKFRSAGRAFTLWQSQFRTKKEYRFPSVAASPSFRRLAGIAGKLVSDVTTAGQSGCAVALWSMDLLPLDALRCRCGTL